MRKSQLASVDVVVPCYRYGHYLPACIDSILSQPDVRLRVLIIDDASPDDSAAVAEQLARQDARITVRRHDVNRGNILTYNEGLLEWAQADYTVLLSADDLLTPGALRRAASVLNAHPDMGLLYGRQIVFQSGEVLPAVSSDPTCRAEVMSGPTFLEIVCATGSNPVPTPTVVVRTSHQQRAGGYRTELPQTGDRQMWMRLSLEGSVGRIDTEQAYYRIHGNNMHQELTAQIPLQLAHWKRTYDLFFDECGARVTDAERLKQLAYRSLAEQAFWAGSRAFDRGDDQVTEQCLQFATTLDPAIRRERSWSRLRLKRTVGSALWASVGTSLHRLRRIMMPSFSSAGSR